MNEIQQIQNSRQEVSERNSSHCNMSEDASVTSKNPLHTGLLFTIITPTTNPNIRKCGLVVRMKLSAPKRPFKSIYV